MNTFGDSRKMLIAYHGNPAIKKQYLARVRAHEKADEIVKGIYWENGKGCAVGCTIHGSNHLRYEIELGIPLMVARLEDTIFEGLPNGEAKKWPSRFLQAIRPGADLSRVGWQFLYWLLLNSGIVDCGKREDVKNVVERSAAVIFPATRGREIDRSAASAALNGAWEVGKASKSLFEGTSWSARSAAAAIWSAAAIAESAARIADMDLAAIAAMVAAANIALDTADAAYRKMAEKLVKLLEIA